MTTPSSRPALLVAEPEPEQALSTRKLVLETAKFNVLTAHSTDEALDVFQKFPNVSAVIAVESELVSCKRISAFVRDLAKDLPIIVLSPRHGFRCKEANYHFSSHDPDALVQHLRSYFGDPRKMDAKIKMKAKMRMTGF